MDYHRMGCRSLLERVEARASNSRHLSEFLRFPLERRADSVGVAVRPPIVNLDRRRLPRTVDLVVRTIIVLALKGQAGCPGGLHVALKEPEIAGPLRTNENAAGAISPEFWMSWTKASRTHVFPGVVDRRRFAAR
jgi:hypothetical protein